MPEFQTKFQPFTMELVPYPDLIHRAVERVLPNRQRIAPPEIHYAPPNSPSVSSDFAKEPTDQLVLYDDTNQRELVICPHYLFDNRWKARLVDYATVERWNPERLQMDNSNLRRVKIYHLNRTAKTSLLQSLESCSRLARVEMDQLELVLGEEITTFNLQRLQVLSIDSIVVVDADEKRVPRGRVMVQFNSNVLSRVILGPNCIDHLKFSNPLSVRALIFGPESSTSYQRIHDLENLEFMKWNHLQEFHLVSILEYALGQRGKLKNLHCNLDLFKSPTQPTDPKRLRVLRNLYNLLKSEGVSSEKLGIAFNGVHLDLEELEFEDYEFDRTPIEYHHHNAVENDLAMAPCRNVSRVDYLQLFDKHFDPELTGNEMPDGLRINLEAFATIYPNVREVNLDLGSDLSQRIGEDPFIHFLMHCRALTTLRLNCCQFTATFYDRLTERVASVRTLDQLTLCEPNRFPEPINVRFLDSLIYLRHLQTNLATRRTMLRLIKRMAVESEFMFGFWEPDHGADFYCCLVKRLDRAVKYCWSLSVEKRNFDDQKFRRELYCKVLSLGQLEDYFERAENATITAHWLDATASPFSASDLD